MGNRPETSIWINLDIAKIENHFLTSENKIVFGIDGYIDEVWEIVKFRSGSNDYQLYRNMKKFGELIVNCAVGGLSTEIIRKRRTYGGFTANTGYAASMLGAKVTMLGLFGNDPVFKEFEEKSKVISIGEPAISHIMEFEDGKIMLVYIKEILEIGWNTLVQSVPKEVLLKTFSEADIIALGYWSNMPAFDDFAEGIVSEFLSADHKQRMFLDFADMRKRDEASLLQTMDKLAHINKKIPITLSLNEHEAELLFASYHVDFSGEVNSLLSCMTNLLNTVSLDEIIIHTPRFAGAVNMSGESAVAAQQFCERPVRTTAAGDNFNGGYLSACVDSLGLGERLAVANASASVFLRQGYSTDIEGLINELKEIKKLFKTMQ